MNVQKAKDALDKVIKKARVHLYKPIQIAEILYRDRAVGDLNLSDLDTYRTKSRAWRDEICLRFLGRTSTSSMRYQDDVFNDNATPPAVLSILGAENRSSGGAVEAYIYAHFEKKYSQMTSGLDYCNTSDRKSFKLQKFLDIFWNEPGLKRSVDKIFEIIVYALFSALIEELDVVVELSVNPKKSDLLLEFDDFAMKVLGIDSSNPKNTSSAKVNRLGVTNAADRGLDMWSNYGPVIQVKHLSLDEGLAEDIVTSISADRIVIVCKDSEERIIVSLLNQIGWKSRIQSIVTLSELIGWYERALRGEHGSILGPKLLLTLQKEIVAEFPSVGNVDFQKFIKDRGYAGVSNNLWKVSNDG